MRVKLPSGREVKVFVQHGVSPLTNRRCTTAKLEFQVGEDTETFLVGTICSKKDAFVRRVGRKIVAQRLLNILSRTEFSKEDRRGIFLSICPEFKAKDHKV